jgi:hypothetical protein
MEGYKCPDCDHALSTIDVSGYSERSEIIHYCPHCDREVSADRLWYGTITQERVDRIIDEDTSLLVGVRNHGGIALEIGVIDNGDGEYVITVMDKYGHLMEELTVNV